MNYNALLKEWINRLGLQEWRIKLFPCCKPEDMTIPDVVGCSEWQESTKTARVDVIDPAYYGKRVVPFDWEQILVHELLHLKTSLISSNVDDTKERVAHQLIDDLARALVDAKRSRKS